MSLADLIGNTVLKFSADTSGARTEIERLTATQKKQAEESRKAIEAQLAAYGRFDVELKKIGTAVESHAAQMTKLQAAFGGLGGAVKSMGAQFAGIAQSMGNQFGQLNSYIGLLDQIYDKAEKIADRISRNKSSDELFKWSTAEAERAIALREKNLALDKLENPEDYRSRFDDSTFNIYGGERGGAFNAAALGLPTRQPAPRRSGVGNDNRPDDAFRLSYATPVDLEALAAEAARANRPGDYDWAGGSRRNDQALAAGSKNDDWTAAFSAMSQAVGAFDESRESEREANRQSRLEQLFGPIEDFDAYALGLSTLGDVFGTLKNASTAAYDAMVTGSMSAGKAFKKAMAESIFALGRDMFVRSLQEGALGVASLALGPIGGASAAKHFAAAGLFATGAAAAGAIASSLGVGGSSAGGAGASRGGGTSAGGYRAVGDGGSGGGNRTVNVIMGGGLADESPRSNARRVSRAVFQAEQQGFSPRPPGVEFS